MMGFLYNNPFFLPGYREITVPKVLLMPEDMVNPGNQVRKIGLSLLYQFNKIEQIVFQGTVKH